MCVRLALVKRQPPVCQEVSYLQTYETQSLFNQQIQSLRGAEGRGGMRTKESSSAIGA